ncbi:squalene synthase HpnC [Planctomicrobium sp. SH664]|uniref:squalene synthase HpnC n=1 Tax=Planctomicrobium sp. SH664 TaxID=3448125 RepID=UPI003F5B2B3A
MLQAGSVLDDLKTWGPTAHTAAPSLPDAESYCRSLARAHYENFPVASLLLPRSLHQPFYNVYAFCRWADDLGDETGGPERALPLLAWWHQELEASYAGQVRHPVFVALKPTIDEFEIPRQLFADLISAFVQDQQVQEYDTFEQLIDYCRRSANPVGRIVLHLCRRHTAEQAHWSDSICTGLQLANFWQDVARDADIGRIYLPREDRQRFGYSDSDFAQRRTTPEFTALMKFEVDRAREYLLTGRPLAARMPGRLRIEIDLFVRGGLLILQGIERIGYRVWEQRPVVSKAQLAWGAVRSLLRLP